MEFSYTQPISYAWNIFKKNWKLLLPAFLIYAFFSSSFNYQSDSEPESISLAATSLVFFISIVMLIFSVIVSIGFMRIVLKLIDGGKPALKQLFSGKDLFWQYIWGTIIYIGVVLGGLLLFIIPGIIWSIKYQFFGQLIVDKGYKGWDAFKKSAEVTNGYKWKLFVFGIVLALFNLLGVLAFVIGIVVTVVVSYIAYLKVYRDLLAASEENSKSEGQPGPKPLYQANIKPEAVSLS